MCSRLTNKLGYTAARLFLSFGILLTLLTNTSIAQPSKRVGIVYSEPTATQFYDRFAYNQLFMSMQNQARMAGIPYDLLTEDDLTDSTKLTAYDALLIAGMQNVTASKLSSIESALDEAVFNQSIGLIVAGDLMVYDEGGTALSNPYSRMEKWLGLSYANSLNGVAMQIEAQDVSHPAMSQYSENEIILEYSKIWFSSYQPVSSQTIDILASLVVDSQRHNGVLATQTGGRNVHFANEQVMADTNLVWSSLQWVMFNQQVPVGLKLGRQDNIFIARNDMDQSMYINQIEATEIPLYELLIDWKKSYNFVGSYYLNIGNDPSAGEQTDWNISGPLYKNYIALGNEIGTHSWTHPHETTPLTPEELEFEFNQSKLEIESQLNIKVLGAAIPGMPESLEVDQQLEQYFAYVSGRSGIVGSGYPGAIGRMWPSTSMLYFSLNLSPDYSLIEFLKHTPAEAEQIWKTEFQNVRRHASQPIIHWLWHDYGPTTATSDGLYSLEMFTNTIEMALASGSEFTTTADILSRILSYEDASLSVTGNNPISASVNAKGVGQFSLQVHSSQVISEVSNWYAYDEDQVFLPDDGGKFDIHLGENTADFTHITDLPMRARLLQVTGDGNKLSFSFEGEGAVEVHLSPSLVAGMTVNGGSSFTRNGNTLIIVFDSLGTHSATLTPNSSSNQAPVASNQSLSTDQDTALAITLSATDPENQALTYAILSAPKNGQLSGTAPNLTYTPNSGFAGTDSFSFNANDGELDSSAATITITVKPNSGEISNPVSTLTLDGSLNDWTGLTSFGSDPDDVSGSSNRIDWLECWFAHDDTLLYLAYRNDGPIELSWGHNTYIDTDGDSTTGYNNGSYYPIGADYLIQATSLYRYTGDGSSWSWNHIGELSSAVSGNQAELSLPREWLGNPSQLQFFFLGENSAYSGGSTEDYYPDGVTDPAAAERFFSYSLNQSSANQAPTASAQSVTTDQDKAVSITLNATDPENSPLSYKILSAPTNGQLSGSAPSLTYTPNSGFTGNDSFTFNANDGEIDSNTATVSITVSAPTSNQAPVANNQSVTTIQDRPLSITLTGSDQEQQPLTYQLLTNPANGQLSGTAPNLTYTPTAGFSGSDSFTFKVNDGELDSSAATISISVNSNSTEISNPVTNLTVDGSLDEWSNLTSFGIDPDDVSGASNLLDWLEGWLAHDASYLYLAYRNDGPITLSWGHNIYLDTDNDSASGYHSGNFYPIGADYLIQATSLYQYTGDGSSWSWNYVGELLSGVSDNLAELSLPLSSIGNPNQLRLFYLGENAAYSGGSTEDYYPDGVTDTSAQERFFSYTIGNQE